MNKEQIIDEAYENYFLKTENITLETLHVPYRNTHLYGTVSGPISNTKFRPYTKEEFISKIKTDSEFSERWGLKIEERDLTREERIDLYAKEYTPGMRNKYEPPFDDFIDAKLSVRNIPTKLITITYNNETIESYE